MDLGVCKYCGYFEGQCRCGKGKILLKSEDRVRISKFMSGLLRHFGRKFGIKIDEDGWADLNEVAKIIKDKYGVGKKVVELIAIFDKKERFEIKNGKIRAKYGHSMEVNTRWSEDGKIPSRLYHATDPRNLQSIMKRGLLPMKRLEVHICADPNDALVVGKRHCSCPVLLEIDAERAIKNGIEIRKKGKLYTADYIPPEYIKLKKL